MVAEGKKEQLKSFEQVIMNCLIADGWLSVQPCMAILTIKERKNLNHNSWSWRGTVGHFRVPPALCFKTRVVAQPLMWKSFFILMQIKLIFTRKVVHLASFWKWGFLELGSDLLQSVHSMKDPFAPDTVPRRAMVALKRCEVEVLLGVH